MGHWRGLKLFGRHRSAAWEAAFPNSLQRARITPGVLDYVRRFRQAQASAHEAGGQLFGTVTPELVLVSEVAGPHRTDERSRYAFRSDPRAAQKEIARFAKRGLAYLGEWHTHAEQTPHPSQSDVVALQEIMARSRLSTSSLLLLIVGLADADADLRVWYIGHSGELQSLT
jgi:integrative and conjugative element protein (TIGR02256 family)